MTTKYLVSLKFIIALFRTSLWHAATEFSLRLWNENKLGYVCAASNCLFPIIQILPTLRAHIGLDAHRVCSLISQQIRAMQENCTLALQFTGLWYSCRHPEGYMQYAPISPTHSSHRCSLPVKYFVHISHLPHATYVSRPYNFPWFRSL